MKFLWDFLKEVFPKSAANSKISIYWQLLYIYIVKLGLNYNPNKFEEKQFKNEEFVKEMGESQYCHLLSSRIDLKILSLMFSWENPRKTKFFKHL